MGRPGVHNLKMLEKKRKTFRIPTRNSIQSRHGTHCVRICAFVFNVWNVAVFISCINAFSPLDPIPATCVCECADEMVGKKSLLLYTSRVLPSS
jgi:hypothetical protein